MPASLGAARGPVPSSVAALTVQGPVLPGALRIRDAGRRGARRLLTGIAGRRRAAPTPDATASTAAGAPPAPYFLINRHAQDQGHRAGVGLALGAEAPGDLVVGLRPHHRPVALVVLAGASSPGHPAAAVVVRNDVVALIRRIAAGADPGDRRHLGAGRTGGDAAAVAGAQRAVDGAIAPIVALGPIAGILRIARALRGLLAGIRIARARPAPRPPPARPAAGAAQPRLPENRREC